MMLNILFLIILIELFIISYLDFLTNKISNYWSIFNILVVIFAWSFVDTLIISWSFLLYPSLFLVGGLFLYALNIVGAGDVKLLFTLFLLVPEISQEIFVISLIISTFVMALILFTINCLKNYLLIIEFFRTRKFAKLKNIFGGKFAYSPVILIAWVLFLGRFYGFFSLQI